jgi:hypothetical protein
MGIICFLNFGNTILVNETIVLKVYTHVSSSTIDIARPVWILLKINVILGIIIIITNFNLLVLYNIYIFALILFSLIIVILLFIWANVFRKSIKKTRIRLEILIYGIFTNYFN